MIGNVNVWFRVNYNGASGYYASYYDDSSYRSEAELTAKYGIPKCGSESALPPPAAPSVSMAQGPAAPAGYRYAITLNRFAPNAGISVNCRDSASPGGFYTFTLTTDGAGNASTASYCYSADGPDHWVVANGVESNHASWGAGSGGSGGTAPPPSGGGGAGSTPPPGGGDGTTVPVNATYNRSAAMAWAIAHAKDPQAYGAMCTWFVSNVLWAGGIPKTSDWTDSGTYGRSAPGTKDAWWLPSFLPYFQGVASTSGPTEITANLKTNAVPQAQVGDLILYDWGQGHGISHVAFIVNIASGQYPEVSEMGQYDLNPLSAAVNKVVHITSKYVKRGWTYSAVHKTYLQNRYPKMKAYLLHINGGYFTGAY